MENYDQVRADFNAIAQLPEGTGWNHNNCYFPYLLKFVPPHTCTCLEIGCGQGKLCALLAEQAEQVIGVDLAEKMIEYAQTHHRGANITHRCGNILDMNFPDASLDLIITTATAHHLPAEWLPSFARTKLAPGGRLIVLDLVNAETVPEKLLWSFAVVPNFLMNLIRNGSLPHSDPRSRALWAAHGEHDTYMTVSQVKTLAARYLPGAIVRRKLFWRYALFWTKP